MKAMMKTTFRLVIVLVATSVAAAYALAEVANWAEPRIAAHRQEAIERAVFKVVPSPAGETPAYTDTLLAGRKVYVVRAGGTLIGWAIPTVGGGFQGNIGIMFGLTPDGAAMTGLVVIESVETPGLGARITEAHFSEQFAGLDVTGKITYVKNRSPEKPRAPGQIDAITGATISSTAVVRIVNETLAAVRPAIAEERRTELSISRNTAGGQTGTSIPPAGTRVAGGGN